MCMNEELVFDTFLLESDLARIIEVRLKKDREGNPLFVFFRVGDYEFGKYAVNLCNRLKCICVLLIEDEELFLRLFNWFLSEPYLDVRVEPFSTLIENVIRELTGNRFSHKDNTRVIVNSEKEKVDEGVLPQIKDLLKNVSDSVIEKAKETVLEKLSALLKTIESENEAKQKS